MSITNNIFAYMIFHLLLLFASKSLNQKIKASCKIYDADDGRYYIYANFLYNRESLFFSPNNFISILILSHHHCQSLILAVN